MNHGPAIYGKPELVKGYLETFYVKGSGCFPFDMLRYDTCWPAHESEARMMEGLDVRVVELHRFVRVGGPPITPARWKSFGWRVLESYEVEAHKVGKVLA